MDAKTAITLQQKARKARRRAFAGQNVNDMRYSCQGFMGGQFPCAPEGPCQFTHCMPCDPACAPECPPTSNAVAGGIAPYAECGPCQFTHCIGCGTPVAGYAGGPFPPTCDYCAPCVYQSTCTPCQGPARQQRWGNQWSPDDFGGRMCFRPCPPDPCHQEIPPPPLPPPAYKEKPKRVPKKPPPKRACPDGWVRPTGSNFCVPGRLTTPEPKCPTDTSCCVVLAGDFLLLKCDDTNHPWHGMDVTQHGQCYEADGVSICELSWTDECGTHTLDLPLCIPGKQPPIIQSFPSKPHSTVPTGPQNITAAPTKPKYPPEPIKPSPTPKTLAFAGRVRTPSSGVGRRR